MTLLLLDVSVSQISARAHGDLQTGAAVVVGHTELHLAGHIDALEDAALGADAAEAALREE